MRMRVCLSVLVMLGGAVGQVVGQAPPGAGAPDLVFCCAPENDVLAALKAGGVDCLRYDKPADAVAGAPRGAGVLIMADGYPRNLTTVPPEVFADAERKELTLYVEFPAALPGLEIGEPRATQWERVVVSDDVFGPGLPKLRILAAHDCRFTPVQAPDPWLVVGRVAGLDRAVFGLPEERFPILFEIPERRLIVATTRLSGFVSGRFAPVSDWRELWQQLLARVSRDRKAPAMKFTPPVRPAYGPRDPLPADAERQSVARAAEWCVRSRLLVHASEEAALHELMSSGVEDWPTPGPDAPVGDGSRGVLEGFMSAIAHDGSQRQRTVLRSDCHAETAMTLAADWAVRHHERSRTVGANLLDYLFFTSEMHQRERGNPEHPAFGHVAWGAIAPAWRIANYGDDDARVILSTILAGTCLETDRFDEPLMRALLANLRTTGPLGFRGSRIDVPDLERHGWKHFHDRRIVNYAPHYEAALWACYLWAYRHTQHREFLDKAKNAIAMTMAAYPDKWMWQNDLERARMVHTLAWLVRIEDTPEHRAWLKRMCDDLLARQHACGAIGTMLGVKGSGHFLAPTSNAEYGTREVPLIQEDGDSVSDQLYTNGFALIGLHEAAVATGDERLREATDRLAGYLCRIQIRSERFPYLDGGWFRAFDYGRWDYWASSGDVGWGAWCIEAGWGQAWGVAAMALREMKTSLWDFTARSRIASQWEPVQALMARNTGGPWKPVTRPAE